MKSENKGLFVIAAVLIFIAGIVAGKSLFLGENKEGFAAAVKAGSIKVGTKIDPSFLPVSATSVVPSDNKNNTPNTVKEKTAGNVTRITLSRPPYFSFKDLSFKTSDQRVHTLQAVLMSAGALSKNIQTTNYFGDETFKALKIFQGRNNLAVTGYVDGDTDNLLLMNMGVPNVPYEPFADEYQEEAITYFYDIVLPYLLSTKLSDLFLLPPAFFHEDLDNYQREPVRQPDPKNEFIDTPGYLKIKVFIPPNKPENQQIKVTFTFDKRTREAHITLNIPQLIPLNTTIGFKIRCANGSCTLTGSNGAVLCQPIPEENSVKYQCSIHGVRFSFTITRPSFGRVCIKIKGRTNCIDLPPEWYPYMEDLPGLPSPPVPPICDDPSDIPGNNPGELQPLIPGHPREICVFAGAVPTGDENTVQ